MKPSAAARALATGGLLAVLSVAAAAERYGFPLTDLATGKKVSLADFKDQAVLVELWQTTCVPCRAVKPFLERLAADHADRDLVILSVDEGESAELAARFLKTHPTTLRVLLDEKDKVLPSLGMSGVPTAFLLDARGKLNWAATGFESTTSDDLRTRVDRIAPVAARLGMVKP